MKKIKNTKAFTLIELLAVIIILGILMIIAIPSVTSYINNSRKSAYIDTAKQVIASTRNFVNEGKVGMYDTSATYYIPTKCIKIVNSKPDLSKYINKSKILGKKNNIGIYECPVPITKVFIRPLKI